MNELRATPDDAALLCGYLHDASFTPSGIEMNYAANRFTLSFERICYEKAQKGKVLFFMPVVRYPWIESRLTVTHVQTFEQEWLDRTFDRPSDKHILLDIEKEGDTTLIISSEGIRLRMGITPETEIILKDTSEPDTSRKITDFTHSIFRGMDQIEELRRRQSKTPSP